MSEHTERRSATDTVVRVLEEFGKSEPVYFLAIWVDEGGDIGMCRTDLTSTTYQLGLLEEAKMMVGSHLATDKETA